MGKVSLVLVIIFLLSACSDVQFSSSDSDGLSSHPGPASGGNNSPNQPENPNNPEEVYENIQVISHHKCRRNPTNFLSWVYNGNQRFTSHNMSLMVFNATRNQARQDRGSLMRAANNAKVKLYRKLNKKKTAGGWNRFPQVEKASINYKFTKAEIDSLISSRKAGESTLFIYFRDGNGNKNIDDLDAVVSTSFVEPQSVRAVSPTRLKFQVTTSLFVGGGDNGNFLGFGERDVCSDWDAELRSVCNRTCDEVYSPLVLDLDNDGTPILNSGVSFDIDATGTNQNIHWLADGQRDPLLALDKNMNGKVDDGSELFGTSTEYGSATAVNGFIALSQHDSNQDKKIDQQDAVFRYLKLWFDRNSNGQTEPGELESAADYISQIGLEFEPVYLVLSDQRSRILARSIANTENDQLQIVDIWFAKKQ